MKNTFDDFLKNLSQTIGEQQAKEIDEHKATTESPVYMIDDLLEQKVLNAKIIRKTSSIPIAICTMFIIFVLFTGGRLIYHFAFEIQDYGKYGAIETPSNDMDFHYTIVPPEGYTIQQEELQNDSTKLVCSNGDNIIIFIESFTETQIDIEDTTPKSVFLDTGYEAFYYEKNGDNLYWQQGGYFYYLFSNDPSVDLLNLASNVEKT